MRNPALSTPHGSLIPFRITFERVGRNHYVPPLEVEAADGDALAHHVHGYVGKYLGSKDYTVTISGDGGSIEYGRFGRFTVETLDV